MQNTHKKTMVGKRKFSIFNYQLSIALMLVITFTACGKNGGKGNTPENPNNPVTAVMQKVTLKGMVNDTGGKPLGGVNVTSGTAKTVTGADGTFTLNQAGVVDSAAVIKFEKNGYFTLTRSGNKQDTMYVTAMLHPKGNSSNSLQTNFNASAAKTLQAGGVKIDLPASCIAKADGSAYSGTVNVDVLYVSPANKNWGQLMPGGDLMGIRSDNSKKMVLPFGIIDVVFTDNAGNLLKVKPNTSIPISYPVPAGATAADLSPTVPLWTFDEAKGVLMENGSLTKQGDTYTGTVSHFSWAILANGYDYFNYMVHAETKCGTPIQGAIVGAKIFVPWYDLADPNDDYYLLPAIVYTTNINGNCILRLPKDVDWTAVITVNYKGEQQKSDIKLMDYSHLYTESFIFDDPDDPNCLRWPLEFTPFIDAVSGTEYGNWKWVEYHGGVPTQESHLEFYQKSSSLNAGVSSTISAKTYELVSVTDKTIKVKQGGNEYILCTGWTFDAGRLVLTGGNVGDFGFFYNNPMELVQ
jgi:hypothetical protein